MHYLEESNILLFLLQLLILIGCARGLGELFRRWKQPALTAEILVGIVLGPTLFGRFLPGLQGALFPPDAIQQSMLETVAWIGILFFLLNNGLEMDFSSAWRQKGDALVIALSDVVIPIAVAFVPCMLLSDSYLADPDRRVLFALFAATIMTISALPVTARVLGDLNIYRTDIGFMIMCALSINDLVGWVVFTQVLAAFTQDGVQWGATLSMVGLTLLFTAVALTLGRRWTDAAIRGIYRHNFTEPGSSLTFVCLVGMLCGVLTIWIGIHALFGFFIAGIVAGESKALPEKTRHTISQMVHSIFIPLFFTSIGLKVDFLSNFNVGLAALFFVVGTVGRYFGAWVGVNLSGQSKADRQLIAIAHTPGGEMQIVVSLLAREYGLLTDQVFVAIVFGAILSSVVLGPWMAWAMRRRRTAAGQVLHGAVPVLGATTRDAAILELCQAACALGGIDDAEGVARTVVAREEAMSTALEYGVAIPHGRIDGLARPVAFLGRSLQGIEWNSPDGQPARLVFLVLTPPGDVSQLQILRSITMAMRKPEVRQALLEAESSSEALRIFHAAIADPSTETP